MRQIGHGLVATMMLLLPQRIEPTFLHLTLCELQTLVTTAIHDDAHGLITFEVFGFLYRGADVENAFVLMPNQMPEDLNLIPSISLQNYEVSNQFPSCYLQLFCMC